MSNFARDNVYADRIDQATGALKAVSTLIATVDASVSVTVESGGKFAYATNYSSNSISAYSINPASGALADARTFTSQPNVF